MSNQALQTAIDCISDKFRTERKAQQAQIDKASQLRAMVQEHRMTFNEGCAALDTRPDLMLEAFDFMVADNFTLNEKYDRDTPFQLTEYEIVTWDWLQRVLAVDPRTVH